MALAKYADATNLEAAELRPLHLHNLLKFQGFHASCDWGTLRRPGTKSELRGRSQNETKLRSGSSIWTLLTHLDLSADTTSTFWLLILHS